MRNKILIFFTLFGGCIASLAQGRYQIQTTIPGTEIRAGNTALSIIDYFQNIWFFGITIGAVLALVAIVYGAIEWTVSAGSESRKSDAKSRITQAILGLTLLFGAYLILSFINPDLVNLGKAERILFQLDELEGAEGSTSQSQTSPQATRCTDCVSYTDAEIPSKRAAMPPGGNASLFACKQFDDAGKEYTACRLNRKLKNRLVKLKEVAPPNIFEWQITESWPPTSYHISNCHYDGTCADISLIPAAYGEGGPKAAQRCNHYVALINSLVGIGVTRIANETSCEHPTYKPKHFDHSTGEHLHIEWLPNQPLPAN